ncbi:Vacuolar protein sorting-associated protein 54, chloroplastic [Psilocybe cubensis]|uniref:Vacuolar protein sorting-associated protein 54, chloroplastic n=2 Tax=Psilocybe cubensis TaxID=181762 RepID=A0ACB8H7I9_PSICU|nr:Vacuolar protein sorting-associated protein 54, chloroplastic [Psilocybe cubensis]KAH9483893.1 Vacuolar protein sorting-associated protein 54, chloroplastic [Psilocybe cubensis]
MSDVSSIPSRATSPINTLAPPDQLPTARPYRFTWDPASRRPGPESVSGTTEGRGGDDFGGAHPLGFLNASTTSLALGAMPSDWSSSRTGFHAISTVLNNPHKRQAPPKAHSLLPPVPPADLPRVRRKDFESYLRAITPEWDRYQHNTQVGRDGQAQIEDSQWTPRNSMAGDEPPTGHRSSSVSHQNGKSIPPLDSVPSVFFQKDFNLGDPKTFANVTEQDTSAILPGVQDDPDPFSLSHSLPLLEKFSHYADTVEQHLVREISIRSTSFFAALTNLHDLQAESERCLNRISKLRTQLQDVDNNGAKRGLEMVRKESKMSNLGKVRDGVKMIGTVTEMTGVAKGLVNAGQWGGALDIIEEMEGLWEPKTSRNTSTEGTPHQANPQNGRDIRLSPTLEEEDEATDAMHTSSVKQIDTLPHSIQYSIPLSSLHAFSALPSHLRTLTMEIAASLSSEFVSVLRNDLELRIGVDGNSNTDADQGLKDRLKPLLLNLVRTKGLKEAVLSWREVVLGVIRGVIKQILPSYDIDDEQTGRDSTSESKTNLANQLRGTPHSDFIPLIQRVYQRLFKGVEGLQGQNTVILDILSALSSQLRQRVTNIPLLEEDLNDILSSSADLSSAQAAKVIAYRAEQHARLDLSDFMTFSNDSWAFVIKCEKVCRRAIIPLRGTLNSQATLFLQTFHQKRISQSAKFVEDELWNPTEVTPGIQLTTNIVMDSAVRDPPELVIQSPDAVFSPVAMNFPTTPGASPDSSVPTIATTVLQSKSSSASTHSTKHLRIEGRTYYVVSATAQVLTLLLDYLKVVVNLSTLTPDTMSRVIEFLKAFNSRTCQVVLGAGAMRSAGLKNITAKHLALASQSLSIVFELIPYVREAFRRHLGQKHTVLLVEFDKLRGDYQEHQIEIHSKLVAIMGDRLNEHIKSLKNIDWTVPKPVGGVNSYMELLVKETVTLHKVLSRYLSPSVVEYVMTQVFAAINHRLSEAYGVIELPDQESKTRLLEDAKYLHQKLAVLNIAGAPAGMLETVVAEKFIPRTGGPNGSSHTSPASPPNAPIRSNTLTANQRLKGLLSGRSSSFADKDKALPPPNQNSSPFPAPSISDKPRSRSPVPVNTHLDPQNGNGLYAANASQDTLANGSSISLSMAVSPIPETKVSQGFKQVEIPSVDLETFKPAVNNNTDGSK